MATRPFRVLHATDGSPSARAAMITSAGFPWPSHSEARAVVVRLGECLSPPADPWARSEALARRAAVVASRTMRPRWPEADAIVRDGDPVDGILDDARHWGAHAVVIGWRGQGHFRRLLMGSVSRAVLRRARMPVLVVRRGGACVTRLVVAVDGSAASARAIRFLARASVPNAGSITLVTVLHSQPSPNHPLFPALFAEIRADILAQGAKEHAAAARRHERWADQLRKAGWRVRGQIRTGAPLYELLRSIDDSRADALVIGATSRSSPQDGSVGSTTEGAVDRSKVPVLVVP
ncbi:universal stress protein [Luteitalea sp.]|uniref:universal stress protein n=1 Tax=Luteitalea sp. TaxID=2004800 RepID=UPI0025B7BC54|nr:universal stress protein [Luteitalea sp.]